MGSNGVTVTKFLQLLMILELYLELSYFFSWISIVVTVTEVTKVPHMKATVIVTKFLFKCNFPIPVRRGWCRNCTVQRNHDEEDEVQFLFSFSGRRPRTYG